jgi:hypothetical protein
MSAMHRGLLRSGSPSSMLKLQKRTLPWGWYFTDLAMQGYRRWGWGVVWERRGGVALLQGDNQSSSPTLPTRNQLVRKHPSIFPSQNAVLRHPKTPPSHNFYRPNTRTKDGIR